MLPSHMGMVNQIASAGYSSALYESDKCLLRKIELFPEGCFGFFIEGRLGGYCVSYPWRRRELAPINHCIATPKKADCLYVDDISVAPRFRSLGVSTLLLVKAATIAREHGFDALAGVAVNGTEWHWLKRGFDFSVEFDYHGVKGRRVMMRLDPTT